MTTFDQFGLPPALATALVRMQYSTPTPIQAQAIPLALQGRDILGSAQTGTGKTAAFAIPMLNRLMTNPRGSALIITPTRELATQVMQVITEMLKPRSFINTALLIGGDSMNQQITRLKMRPRIIVGTPGRINDHLERGNLILHDVCYFVLDETDRMLDMGFGIQIDKIAKFLPPGRQTLLFSATIPDGIAKMSSKYLTNPERISVGATNVTAAKIEQEIIHVNEKDKFEEMMKQVEARNGSIILFVKTKRGADRMADKLTKRGQSADTIHGDLHQRQRERVIQAFRDYKFRILVATDIASRGLDISHIEHVINYDLPQCPEDYIHRIGRTGRNGAEGAAICLISPDDHDKWKAIWKMLNPGEKMPPLPRGERSERPHSGARRSHGRSTHHHGGHGKDNARNGEAKPNGERRHGQSQGEAKTNGGRQDGKPHEHSNSRRRRRFRPRGNAQGHQPSA